MNTLFIEFRDPLFSIIIFFSIIFLITFFSYWWGKYKFNEDSKYLDDFLKKFRSLPSKNELESLISSGEMSEKSWLLLASSYSKDGNYEKSIDIYNGLLSLKGTQNKKETMFLLGKTYFKAGFLERSKQIFISILKTNPRTPQALHYLLLVYEYMKEYTSALEVLEPLDELNEDVLLDRVYLEVMQVLGSNSFSNEEKVEKVLRLYKSSHKLTYTIFDFLFKVNPGLAWRNFDSSKSELLVDILWRIEAKNLDLDIISNNGYLRELYSARGDFDLADSSLVFEFDTLIKLKRRGANATLAFEYVCDSCKNVYPFVFTRCTYCHEIDTSKVEWSLVKDYHKDFSEENNSFQ